MVYWRSTTNWCVQLGGVQTERRDTLDSRLVRGREYVCSYAVSVPFFWLVSHRVADVMHRVYSVPLDALPDLCGVDQVKCSQSRQTRAAVCMLWNMC